MLFMTVPMASTLDGMYDRMVKVGSTAVLSAVSVFLMQGSGLLALISLLGQRDKSK